MSHQDKPASDANAQVVRRLYGHMFAGEFAKAMNIYAPDVVVYESPSPSIPFGGTYHGTDGVMELFAKITSMLDIRNVNTKTVCASGDDVLALVEISLAKGEETATAFFCEHFKVVNEKVQQIRVFLWDNDLIVRMLK